MLTNEKHYKTVVLYKTQGNTDGVLGGGGGVTLPMFPKLQEASQKSAKLQENWSQYFP